MVMANLRINLPEHVLAQFTIGFGVILPDCEFLSIGAEWDSKTLAGARNYKDIERWLSRHALANVDFLG